MTLTYEWENVKINYRKHQEVYTKVKDVKYDYEVDVKIQDIVDYLIPFHLTKKKEKTREEITELGLANFYMTKAIDELITYARCDLEELESDEYFVEFMKERYEDEAWESFQEENEDDE